MVIDPNNRQGELPEREEGGERVCKTCDGFGYIHKSCKRPVSRCDCEVEHWTSLCNGVPCPDCGGTGYALKIPGPLCCPTCGGSGKKCPPTIDGRPIESEYEDPLIPFLLMLGEAKDGRTDTFDAIDDCPACGGTGEVRDGE